MREDSQAMPPPPAPPPLPSPGAGQIPGVPDQFPQLPPQEGKKYLFCSQKIGKNISFALKIGKNISFFCSQNR